MIFIIEFRHPSKYTIEYLCEPQKKPIVLRPGVIII